MTGGPRPGLVWIDGVVTSFEDARVSPEDRGYLFADGVYEVIRAYGGALFEAGAHVERLGRSAAGIDLVLPLGTERLLAIVKDLQARAGIGDAEIYIQVTRGVAPRLHLFPEGVAPTVLIWIRPIRAIDPAARAIGVRTISLPDERWARCDLKTIALLPNVLAKERAHRAGAFEALLNRDGRLTEGTSSNALLVKDGALVSPIADARILPGITRAVVLSRARALGIVVEEREVGFDEVYAADELWLTSTTLELMPVVEVDGRSIGGGRPGPVLARLLADYQARVPLPR